jgi:hypothetical protein
MEINVDDLVKFEEICRKICLNIPAACDWQWDEKRHMAVVVLEQENAELVFFPLFKEFQNHWNFDSTPEEAKAVSRFVDEKYGLMPGQVFFTSYVVSDLVLAVAWWPWGSDRKVSMRVGLIPVNHNTLGQTAVYQCLSRWFRFEKTVA